MSAEGFEKTRIQDPDEAHEIANMLAAYVEGEKKPTAEDYDEALRQLEMLQKDIEEERVPESVDKALRTITAGGSVAMETISTVLVLAALHVLPYPARVKEHIREHLPGGNVGIIDRLKGVGGKYEETRVILQTARETLEKWKAEAEEIAKR